MLYVALDKDLGLGQRFCFCGVWIDVLKALDRVRTPHVFMSQSSPFDTLCCVIEFFYLLSGDGLTPEKADEVFIQWLKSNRESGISVTLPKVKEKVAQLFQTFGTSTIEKTCKWFLLWNNR